MTAFGITEEQAARIIGALSADELSRRFNRHFDFLTIASWTADTPFGAGGIEMSAEETAVCAERAAQFFGLDIDFLKSSKNERIADWASDIASAIAKRLTQFTFKSAARDERAASCVHSAREILQDANAVSSILQGRRRVLSMVAPHSLLGFELSILTPNLQKIESADVRAMTPEQISQMLRYGDVLVATPSLWRYLMHENMAAPDNTMAVAFGEPMTAKLAAQMRQAGFGAMRELYGSTETGLIGWRDAPGENFILFDHWKRNQEKLVRISPDNQERPLDAMDFLEWSSERTFRLSGRRDGAVQIGAVNVIPDDVAQRLGQHPLVSECSVRIGRRGDGVDRLIAHIVLKKNIQPGERIARDIDAWCRTALRHQERPRIYHFEESLD